MATTFFVNGVTLTDAGWFNDLDAVGYDGLTTQILVGGGAGVAAVWTAATGSGAPVRATSPTIATPTISGALTYGGVTLTANVTGTGKMVLDTSPTIATPVINSAAHVGGSWVADAIWTLPALTLGGTVSGGGNQINNVIIGTTTPLAGSFTTISASGSITSTATGALFSRSGASTSAQALSISNTTGTLTLGVENSAGGTLAIGTAAYATVLGSTGATSLHLITGNASRLTINSAGAVTIPGTLGVTGLHDDAGNMILSSTNVTIGSGFGTGSITSNNTAGFIVTCGNGGGNTGVLTLPTAPNGWIVFAENMSSNASGGIASIICQTAKGTTSATLDQRILASGAAANWVNGDIILCHAFPY